jgi:heme-degrading monooxygenase HmoA
MIARVWRGRASGSNADAYEDFLRNTPAAARIAGFRAVHVLRRSTSEGEAEFTTVTRFDSMDAIKTFVDDDPEATNVAPRIPRATLSFRAAPAFTMRS